MRSRTWTITPNPTSSWSSQSRRTRKDLMSTCSSNPKKTNKNGIGHSTAATSAERWKLNRSFSWLNTLKKTSKRKRRNRRRNKKLFTMSLSPKRKRLWIKSSHNKTSCFFPNILEMISIRIRKSWVDPTPKDIRSNWAQWAKKNKRNKIRKKIKWVHNIICSIKAINTPITIPIRIAFWTSRNDKKRKKMKWLTESKLITSRSANHPTLKAAIHRSTRMLRITIIETIAEPTSSVLTKKTIGMSLIAKTSLSFWKKKTLCPKISSKFIICKENTWKD